MPRVDRREVAAIFAGGALGTLARAGLAEAFPHPATAWPWPTFGVNIVAAWSRWRAPGCRPTLCWPVHGPVAAGDHPRAGPAQPPRQRESQARSRLGAAAGPGDGARLCQEPHRARAAPE